MPAYRSLFSGFAQLAEEVGQASRANRELFEQLVAAEVGRVAARLGIVPAAELRETRERLDTTRAELGVLRSELDDLQLRVATLEAAMPDADLPDLDLDPDLDPAEPSDGEDVTDAVDAPDLLGDETGSAARR